MRIAWIAAAAALALAGCGVGFPPMDARAAEPNGAVVLTVAGELTKPNRPAYDRRRDVFFKYHERSFGRAVEFDRAMLEALGVVRARIEFAGWDGPKDLSGPRLVDVLTAAGCASGPIATLALDGFATELSADALSAHGWFLSTRANGRPHAIGGRGPLWLVFDPPGDRPATAEEESMWPWQLFFIRCGAAP